MKFWPKPFMEPERLKQRLLALSAADILLCPEDWLRRYRYNPNWDEGSSLATISNGSGDDMFIVFTPEGVIVKGFDHESGMSPHARDDYGVWPGIYDQVPASLLDRIKDESMTPEEVTFCLWREVGDSMWRTGDVHNPDGLDDGSDFLLGMIYETAEDYTEWAEDYYEVDMPEEVVSFIFAGRALSKDIVGKLVPAEHVEEALKELQALGLLDLSE